MRWCGLVLFPVPASSRPAPLSLTLRAPGAETVTSMVSLYNTLAVKLMDAKNYENALSLLRKVRARRRRRLPTSCSGALRRQASPGPLRAWWIFFPYTLASPLML